MLLVVDATCLAEAFETDSYQMLETLKTFCEDKIVTTQKIRNEYVAFSNLLPQLEELKEQPRPKAIESKAKPVEQIPGLRSQHDSYVKDAVGLPADIFITKNPQWKSDKIQLPRGCLLKIITPAQYVKMRRKKR